MGSYQIYMRHPHGVPLSLQQVCNPVVPDCDDPGVGVICHCATGYGIGEQVRLMIPQLDNGNGPLGRVDWCQPVGSGYELGIRFRDRENAMRARMLEQLSHIYRYRQQQLQQQGRFISLDQAAHEWIARYAALFPADHV